MARFYDTEYCVWVAEIFDTRYDFRVLEFEFDTSHEAYQFVDTCFMHATMQMSFKVYPKKKESEEILDAETL